MAVIFDVFHTFFFIVRLILSSHEEENFIPIRIVISVLIFNAES